jgi:hypothetical protein
LIRRTNYRRGVIALLALAALLLSACTLSSPAAPVANTPPTAAAATVATSPPPTPAPPAAATELPCRAPALRSSAVAPPTIVAKAATRLDLRPVQEAGHVYGLEEFEIDTDGVAANPFDPAQFDLRVRFMSPSGAVVLAPAFSYQDFDAHSLCLRGGPVWRARFTPSEAGAWQAQAELADPKLSSAPVNFKVEPDAGAHGFVRVNKQNPRYLAFDDGSFYFPIGLNLGWANQPNLGVLADYGRWLDRLSQNGGNIGRVWMAAWSFGIEWNDTGLGNYAGRMKQAWLLDQVFKLAEQRHVYLMLTLLNHGAFSTSVNPEWDENPYNAANGGPLKEPRLFARNRQAREFFKHRVRYIAARWGYSPNLFAWEWRNEVNWTPIDDSALKPWIAEMTAYLQQYDPYRHLVSSSYAGISSTPLWKMPELSFAQQHDYSGNDLADLLPITYHVLADRAPEKPVLLAELGLNGGGANDQRGLERIQFHNGIWAAPFSGYAGTAMYWWWDTFVDAGDQWGEYKRIADFMQGEDLAPLASAKAQIAPAGARALALQGDDRALVWVRSDAYQVFAANQAYEKEKARQAGQDPPNWTYEPPPLDGLKLTLTGLADGSYTVRWFSPTTGEWQPDQTVRVDGGTATLAVPPLARDLAVKIENGE